MQYGLPSLDALDPLKNYEVRSSAPKTSSGLEIARNLSLYVAIPLLISHFFSKKEYFYSLIIFLILFYILLSTASKFALSYTALIIGFSFLLKFSNAHRPIICGLIFMGFMGYFARGTDFHIISNLFFFRPIEIPAWLAFEYHNFFNRNQLLYFSESFEFIRNPYGLPAPRLIGNLLFPEDGTTWANTGLWGSAFSNVGYVGIILHGLILGMVLWVYESISDKKAYIMPTAFMITTMFYLAHSGLTAILSSRGLLIAMVLIWLYKGITYLNDKKFT